MRWRDLTPDQLRSIASDLHDAAQDDEVDRAFIRKEKGFDAVAATRVVARRLEREAQRRERKAAPVVVCPVCYSPTYREDGVAHCTDHEPKASEPSA